MRYTKKVQKIEKDTDPLVLQWFWDVTKNYFHTINVRNFDADKIKRLKKHYQIFLKNQLLIILWMTLKK